MTRDVTIALLDEIQDGFNRHDVDAILGHFADDRKEAEFVVDPRGMRLSPTGAPRWPENLCARIRKREEQQEAAIRAWALRTLRPPRRPGTASVLHSTAECD